MKSKTVAVKNISSSQMDRLYSIFETLYDNISRAEFNEDLLNKDYVLMLFSDSKIVGFSTIKIYREEGRHTIFSGDTAILKEHWGNKKLQIGMSGFLLFWVFSHPLTQIYWLLVSKGYKTYLLIANNISDFAPSIHRGLTASEKKLAYSILEKKYSKSLDREQGLLVFTTPSCRVKEQVCSIQSGDLANEHIRFFAEKNPNHGQGNELICVARIKVSDMVLCMGRHLFRPKKKQPLSVHAPVPLHSEGMRVRPKLSSRRREEELRVSKPVA